MVIGDNDDDDDDHHHRRMAITIQEETDEVMDDRWRHTVEAYGHFQLARHADMLTCDLSIGNYFVNEFSAFQIECPKAAAWSFSQMLSSNVTCSSTGRCFLGWGDFRR
jgi:hypothetical protein